MHRSIAAPAKSGFTTDYDRQIALIHTLGSTSRQGTCGPVTTPSADERWKYDTDEASAKVLSEALTTIGALIAGRRLFDITKGWGGRHPAGCPVVVVTHTVSDGWPRDDAPFTFVTDGIESAVAKAEAIAGDKIGAVASPNITQQCLNLGLLDEIRGHARHAYELPSQGAIVRTLMSRFFPSVKR